MNDFVFFKLEIKKILLSVLMLFLVVSCKTTPETGVNDLRVEYLKNPLGVDTPAPRFSWKIRSGQRGLDQEAFQLIVAEDPEGIREAGGALWNSGKVRSSRTVNLKYEGEPLESNTKYYWGVRVWTGSGEALVSDPAFFHTGILRETGWKARWITTREEVVSESPLFRKEFRTDKKIAQAIAFVTATGFYEFYLNGEKVGDHVLDPGITDYRKTVLYSTYDVTSLLKKGPNAAGAMLGNGAWNLRKTEGRWSWGGGGTSFGNPSFLMQLMIDYADGSRDLITTDQSWRTAPGPVTFNNLYGGEDYDARQAPRGWSSPGFDDAAWQEVIETGGPGGILKSQMMPPIKVTKTLQPVKEINPEPGVSLFDLGQNIAGWWRMKVKGTPGQVIRVRGAETLNDSLFPKPLETGDRLSTKYDYHAQTWTDYTVKDEKTALYEPRFFYTGFRYIEVTTSDQKNPELLNIEGRVVRSALRRNGTFQSSDSLLNRIYQASVWSQKGNMQSYPTDCPHREKGAYNGDGQVIAETSMHDFHMAPFYTKWINDMRDAQQENGWIPNTSPTLVGGMGGGVAWGSAYILIPWWMYHYYHDTRILEDHYPAMKRYLHYLKHLAKTDENPEEPYIINDFGSYWLSLGEWCAPGQSDGPNHPVVHTFYFYYNTLLLSKIAAVLDKPGDANAFSALSDTIRQAFNEKFFDPETGLYGTEEPYQTYQLLALAGDLVPEEQRQNVFDRIVRDIEARNFHLNTGIIGTKYLFPVLTEGGRNDLAYKILQGKTYPGYGYWMENGSTTLLEKWSGEHSHNHQMFGSVEEYFYKYLAGIRSPLSEKVSLGYQTNYIEPYVPAGLNSVSASVETPAGTLSSSWEKAGRSFRHQISIPANTRASLALPLFDGENNCMVWEGETVVWKDNRFLEGVTGISEAEKVNDRLVFWLESGKYSFRMENETD